MTARKAILSSVGIHRYAAQLSAVLATASIAWPLVVFVFLYGVGAPLKHLMWVLGIISLLLLLRRPSDWLSAPGMGRWLAVSACLLVPMLLSLLGAEQIDRSVSGVLRIGFYVLGGFWLMRWVPRPEQEAPTLLAVLAVIMMFVLDGYLQLLTGINISGQTTLPIPGGYKITGSMGVNYGESLAILSPLVFVALRRHVADLPILWLCVPLLTGAVVISASRNSLLLLALAGFLYLVIAGQTLTTRQRLLLLVGGGTLMASGIALPLFWLPHLLERILALPELLSYDPTTFSKALSWRPELWQAAGQVFLENPVNGVGLRGSGDAMLPFLQQSPLYATLPIQEDWYPHLMVLEVATDLGLLGLLGYAVFLWCLIDLSVRSSGLAKGFALMALLAFFPLSASLSVFSYRISLLGWPALAFAVGLHARTLREPAALASVRRILIIRLSALGDVVFATPLIQALRRRYPSAQISWVVEPAAKPLLQHNSQLDDVLVWDKQAWRDLWQRRNYLQLVKEILRLRRRWHRRQFDLALDVQGLYKSAALAMLSGARHRVGFTGKENTAPLLTWPITKPANDTRICSEYWDLAAKIGLPVDDFRMSVGLSPRLQAFAAGEAEQSPYVVIAPFTTRAQKHWQDSHWFELAELIDRQYGWRILMLGGPDDVPTAARLAENSVIENRVGDYTLDESAALVSRAALLVGVDTGLTHMGIAFAVPTVALFGSTCPYRETGSEQSRVLYHDLPCAPCRRRPTCEGRFECMTEITPAEVMGAIAAIPGLN